MEREWLLSLLVVLLGGMTLQALAWIPAIDAHDTKDHELERKAWVRLWCPAVPALLIGAALGGWALTESDPVHDRLGALVLYAAWTPFAVIFGRAALRAVWALLRRTPDCGVSTIGLIQPETIFSPFLAKQLSDSEVRAALAHEQAHARHRDPLRIWLAQLLTDLQWPWPAAQRRLEAWLIALELARDEEARRRGTDGADLAAAVLASVRFLQQLPTEQRGHPSSSGTSYAHARLIGDSGALRDRVSRLLGSLPKASAAVPAVSSSGAAEIFLLLLMLLAAALGIAYGGVVMHFLLALTS